MSRPSVQGSNELSEEGRANLAKEMRNLDMEQDGLNAQNFPYVSLGTDNQVQGTEKSTPQMTYDVCIGVRCRGPGFEESNREDFVYTSIAQNVWEQ